MGKYCFISSCLSNTKESLENGESRKSMFKFPSENEILKTWLNSIQTSNETQNITKHSRICELHFQDKYLVISGSMKKLTNDAVPTENLNLLKKSKSSKTKLTETSEKCRFCLKRCSEKIEINKKVQKQFVSLTQTELRPSEIYSNFICKVCHHNLNFSITFKQKILENQEKLHNALETFEFGSDNEEAKENSDFESLVDVKMEELQENLEVKEEISELQQNVILSDIKDLSQQEISFDNLPDPDDNKDEIEFMEFADAASFDFPILDVPEIPKKARKKPEKSETVPKKSSETTQNQKKDFVLCYECGGVFKPKSLRKHMDRAHLNKRNYICDLCGHQSYHRYQIRNHITIHTTEKHYICQECGKL